MKGLNIDEATGLRTGLATSGIQGAAYADLHLIAFDNGARAEVFERRAARIRGTTETPTSSLFYIACVRSSQRTRPRATMHTLSHRRAQGGDYISTPRLASFLCVGKESEGHHPLSLRTD